jgi:ribosome biogenesis protein Nip4
MKDLKEFINGIGAKYELAEEDAAKINTKRFLVNNELKKFVFNKEKLTYIGKYLGKMKKEFLPSSILLEEISAQKLNKVYVDKKTAWLFVCGRDIFKRNVLKIEGISEEGSMFLVMFEDRCIGYGKVDMFEGRSILKNVFDLGDFLRREREND